MGIIDFVDDRDITYNQVGVIGTPMSAALVTIYKQIEQQLSNEFSSGAVSHLGDGFFHLELGVIMCTGSDIVQYFSIPFRHKLHQFVVKHTDNADADSVTTLDYTLKYGLGQIKPNLLIALLDVDGSVESDTIHLFPNFWRRQTRYQLTTNTTNTNRLYTSIIMEITPSL